MDQDGFGFLGGAVRLPKGPPCTEISNEFRRKRY
jgi:hypothetical protein